MTGFEVIQHPKEGFKGRFIVISAIEAGLEALFSDDLLRFELLHWISALSHQADAGNQPYILLNEPLQVLEQRFSHVLLQIL